jgi:hypothetical protein
VYGRDGSAQRRSTDASWEIADSSRVHARQQVIVILRGRHCDRRRSGCHLADSTDCEDSVSWQIQTDQADLRLFKLGRPNCVLGILRLCADLRGTFEGDPNPEPDPR